jgi:hypothetical protein
VGIVIRYMLWIGHDAEGTLPPLDVVAGIVKTQATRLPTWWPPLGPDEILVLVPAQWIGEWESGHSLAPAYQHLWRAPQADLHALPSTPTHISYRPNRLPESASGPRLSRSELERTRKEVIRRHTMELR